MLGNDEKTKEAAIYNRINAVSNHRLSYPSCPLTASLLQSVGYL